MKTLIVQSVLNFVKKLPPDALIGIGTSFFVLTLVAISFLGGAILWLAAVLVFFLNWIANGLSHFNPEFPRWSGKTYWWINGISFLAVVFSYHLEGLIWPLIFITAIAAIGYLLHLSAKRPKESGSMYEGPEEV